MLLNWPWAKFYHVRCPDGTTRTVYKNMDDTCPLYIHGWKAEVAADITGLSKLSGEAKAKYETHIGGLLFSLNEQNQSLMMSFRTVYTAFVTNPCANDGFLHREIEKLLDDQRRISALKIQIEALIQLASTQPNDTGGITRLFSEIASRLGGSSVAMAATLEIAETRAVAKNMIRVG